MATKLNLNKAALDGLMLAAVTIILLLIKDLSSSSFFGVIIWLAKLALTMYLLYFFMKRNTQNNKTLGVSTSFNDAFKYGFVVSMFSVILICAFQYLMMIYGDQDTIRETVWEQLSSSQYSQYDFESSEATINRILDNLPLFTLIFSLVYYTIWSLIASAILAGSCKSESNPFEEHSNENNSNSITVDENIDWKG